MSASLRLEELEDLLDDLAALTSGSASPPITATKSTTVKPQQGAVPGVKESKAPVKGVVGAPKKVPANLFTSSQPVAKPSPRYSDIVEVQQEVVKPHKEVPHGSQNSISTLEAEISLLTQSLNSTMKKKSDASAAEEYELAAQLKTESETHQDKLKSKQEELSKLQNEKKKEQPSMGKREQLQAVYDQKKKELDTKKNECVQNEDYDGANHYKVQMEQLLQNFKKDLAASGFQSSPTPSPNKIATGTVPASVSGYKPPGAVKIALPQESSPTAKPNRPGPTKPHDEKKDTLKNTMRKKQAAYTQDSKVYDAVRSGRIQDLKAVLEQGISVNSVDFETGNNGLHAAVQLQSKEIIPFLVEKGIDCNLKNRRGQTPLHLSCEKLKRMDDMTRILVEKGKADMKIQDNTGKTPLDYTGAAPKYYQELKEWYSDYLLKKPAEKVAPKPVSQLLSEAIQVYLRSGTYYTFVVTELDTAAKVVPLIAEKLKVEDIANMLELCEEVMGKERKLKDEEVVLETKANWPNENPTYCKFKVKIQRGAPSSAQMKFREAMYG